VKGKTAIVTGAARGIGRYIAKSFAAEGARVAVVDIDMERLHRVEGELKERGVEALALNADVRNEDEVRSMAGRAAERFGGIDVLVNNAGVVPHFAWGLPRWPRVRDMDKGFWERVVGTNLGGTFLCSKHVLPYMEAARQGHIVNLHGGGDVRPPGALAYVLTKEALRTFTRYVAEEEREFSICVVIMSPGGAIAHEEAPEEARRRMPGPESIGNRFVLAAQAPLELSGHLLTLKEGRLEIVP
jgi:3-oxoacyl-[acyl-carrier protein] reductase